MLGCRVGGLEWVTVFVFRVSLLWFVALRFQDVRAFRFSGFQGVRVEGVRV